MVDTAQRKLEEGMALEQEGQLDEAMKRYDEAIALQPDLARAHFNRGTVLLDRGEAQPALDAFAIALSFKPDSVGTLYNIGNAHLILDKVEDGVIAFRQAIELKPEFVDAHIALGMALARLGEHREAVGCFSRAAQLDPSSLEAFHQQGIAFQDLGEFDNAVNSYRRALEIDRDLAALHSNLGSALRELGRNEAAIASFERALEISPKVADVRYNLGLTFQTTGRMDLAATSYIKTLEIENDHFGACMHLGIVLHELGQYEKSLLHSRRAIELQPSNEKGHLNLGLGLTRIGRLDEAVTCYLRALEIQPDNADAHLSLGHALKDLSRVDEGIASIQRALESKPDYLLAHNSLLFVQNYVAEKSSERMLENAHRFGEVVARLARPYTNWPNSVGPDRPLRIGFVSGDLCSHPVGYFLEGVLAALTVPGAQRLELFAYPTRSNDDATTKRLRACCKGWHSAVGLSDEALAKRIRDDGIDILIDLAGHSAHTRLSVFAWKPAPVQVSWLGYFATTGVAAMDYFIADPWTLPPDQEAYFTEKIWRLPETRLCFTPPDAKVEVNTLPALANGYITFGSFNNLSKMTDAVVQLWARVLQAVPQSRLFLKYQQLAEASVRQSTYERFAVHGIEADRLIFEDYVPRASYLAAYHRVDIGLDPFPFPGGTTTVEALWMGIPVLTLTGERFLSRQGVGLLMNAGLPDWIAADPDDYVARAIAHASDLPALAILRAGLRQQVLASPIYDAPRFAQHFEQALRGMWQTWCEEQ